MRKGPRICHTERGLAVLAILCWAWAMLCSSPHEFITLWLCCTEKLFFLKLQSRKSETSFFGDTCSMKRSYSRGSAEVNMMRNNIVLPGKKSYMGPYLLTACQVLKRSTRCMRAKRTQLRHSLLRASALGEQVKNVSCTGQISSANVTKTAENEILEEPSSVLKTNDAATMESDLPEKDNEALEGCSVPSAGPALGVESVPTCSSASLDDSCSNANSSVQPHSLGRASTSKELACSDAKEVEESCAMETCPYRDFGGTQETEKDAEVEPVMLSTSVAEPDEEGSLSSIGNPHYSHATEEHPAADGVREEEPVHVQCQSDAVDEPAYMSASVTEPDEEGSIPLIGNPYYFHATEDQPTADGLPEDEPVHAPFQSEFEWSRCEKARLCAPVCQCSDVTVGDILFMTLTVGFKHNLSWDAQLDILRLLSTATACKEIPCSKTGYFNYVEKMKHACSFHIFCPDCGVYLGEKAPKTEPTTNIDSGEADGNTDGVNRKQTGNSTKRQTAEAPKVFRCESCNESVDPCKAPNFFVSVSIEAQLKTIVTDEGFAHDLVNHRFERQQKEGVVSDIYDGAEYRKHCGENGVLSSKFNFSWTIFTDGISTGRSTGKTMWPIYLSLNEAPKKVRHKYIILAGLYVGSKDPNPWVFFEPVVKEMNKLSTDGFSWTYNGSKVTSRVIPLLVVTDSVARYQLLNMQSYFAFYGCTFCYQVQTATAPKKRRFDALSTPAPLRTAESSKRDAVEAYQRALEPVAANRVVRGVKGASVLLQLKYLDVMRGFTVDPMHAIFLGVVKTHMEYLFESLRNKFWVHKNIGIEERMRRIDERLLKITPPTGITRNTRSIASHKLWKASEWRTWIMFYCIPCLTGLLKHKHVVHLAQLSKATCLLLQESVSVGEIAESRYLFTEYAKSFQRYFDVRHTIYNVHLLQHVPLGVENFGPLWTHDAFPYEGQNRHLLQLLTGYNHAVYQVTRRFLIFASLPRLYRDFVKVDRVAEFAERTLGNKFQRYDKCGEYVLTGKMAMELPQELTSMIRDYYGIPPTVKTEVQLYTKILCNRTRFTVAEYVGEKLNNDSYVFIKDRRYALHISHFAKVACVEPSIDSVVMIGKMVKLKKEQVVASNKVSLTHVRKVRKVGGLLCASIPSIDCQGVIMSVCGEHFIARMAYGCYGD